jgi:hypothetical protein
MFTARPHVLLGISTVSISALQVVVALTITTYRSVAVGRGHVVTVYMQHKVHVDMLTRGAAVDGPYLLPRCLWKHLKCN